MFTCLSVHLCVCPPVCQTNDLSMFIFKFGHFQHKIIVTCCKTGSDLYSEKGGQTGQTGDSDYTVQTGDTGEAGETGVDECE